MLHPSYWLGRPWAVVPIVLVSLILLAPCLATGFVMDDYVLAAKAGKSEPVQGLPADPWWMFTFTTGDPARNAELMNEGVLLPWWTEPTHLNAFFRPLSALTHMLDFRFWPQDPVPMHVQSLLWYAALLVALGYVYRRLDPSAPGAGAVLAGLSLLLYAIDDAHGPTVGWIANRNALVSLALALPALAAHQRWRAHGSRIAAVLAPVWFALGLGAGETAICLFGYLIAYAVYLDERPLRSRVLSLAPYVALLIAHRALYHLLGLGSHGSSAYHDPLHEPIAFLRTLGYNLPVLLSAQLLIPIADLAFWGEVRALGFLWLWASASLVALGWFAWPLLKRDPQARFWALGMLLSAVPISASLPGERLLLVVGLGGSALLARLLFALYTQARSVLAPDVAADALPWSRGVFWPVLAVPARMHVWRVLFGLHLLAAPLMLPLRAYTFEPLAKLCNRVNETLPSMPPLANTFVIVNAPVNVVASYFQVARAVRGTPRPHHLYWLSSSSSDTYLSRIGVSTLRVEQERGFMARPEETHYRSDPRTMPVGTRVALGAMEARVAATTPDGRPRIVDFTFKEPLGSPGQIFGFYQDGDLTPLELPGPGERVLFPAQDFFKMIVDEVLR